VSSSHGRLAPVGFASQSLIKDVINGLFILFEDSLSVWDVVTLRAVTIRDLAGTVHVIPNGTIDMIANTTKDYLRYVLDVGIAYRGPLMNAALRSLFPIALYFWRCRSIALSRCYGQPSALSRRYARRANTADKLIRHAPHESA
jgi:Mechanosensitive ion channel